MAKSIIGGVYSITNTVTGKRYIGSAIDISKRLWTHRNALGKGTHPNVKLSRGVDKYGVEAFLFEVVEVVVDRCMLILREQHWIDSYDSVRSGYNIAPKAYSSLGRKATPETRAKLSAAHKGRKMSEEQRLKYVGRKVSDETRRRISESLTGRTGGKWSEKRRAAQKNVVGRKLTPEQIEKLRVINLGKKVSAETRERQRVAQLNRPPVTEETRLKLAEAGMGRVFSEEARRKISAALSGVKKGPLPDEVRAKVSAALVGKKKPPRTPEHIANLKAAWALKAQKELNR